MFFLNNIRKSKKTLPGFGMSMGIVLTYLSLLVLLPLSMLVIRGSSISLSKFIEIITQDRALASFKISFGCAFAAAFINLIFGFIIAWVLVRYDFWGKKIIDALVDLPFALPTAVAGITLTSLYAVPMIKEEASWFSGYFGVLLEKFGIKVAFAPLGIVFALVFISLPFVVRTIEPVLEDLEPELEEAGESLGAGRFTIFLKIILPNLIPSMLTGFSLAFARALGEYGSVVFISGNMPYKTEIIPLLIMTRLEQYDYDGAVCFAITMLLVSFLIMLFVNLLSYYTRKRFGKA